MEPIKMETEVPASSSGAECTHCAKVAEEAAKNEEVSLAFLLALVPVISLTFFGQIGLL